MNFPLLLLPDEICLLDDDDVFFELYCEPTGFNFLGYRDVDVELRCQSYLTSNRLIFVPWNSKHGFFSICIESIRHPRFVESSFLFQSTDNLEFDVCLNHGTFVREGTIASFLPHPTQFYKSCSVACKCSTLSKTQWFLKGLELMMKRGLACPTRRCQFLEYEDLPTYVPTPDTSFDDKLPVYSVVNDKEK